MKTTIKSAIIFSALALLSTGVFAAGNAKTDTLTNDITASVTYYDNSCGLDVNITKATKGDSMVTICDADGNVVLNDKFTVDTDTVHKSYLVTRLADGDYTIAIATGEDVITHTIQLSSDESDTTAFAF